MKTIERKEYALPIYSPLPDIDHTELDPKTSKVLQMRISDATGFDELNIGQHTGALWAKKSLDASITQGLIDIPGIRRILDFGAGHGGPTFALVHVADLIDARVEAVQPGKAADEIINKGILPASDLHREDGFAFLERPDSENLYDLITSFMLDDRLRTEFPRLAIASRRALRPHGKLLITSDNTTLSVVKDTSKRAGVFPENVPELSMDDNIVVPQTLLFSKESLASF